MKDSFETLRPRKDWVARQNWNSLSIQNKKDLTLSKYDRTKINTFREKWSRTHGIFAPTTQIFAFLANKGGSAFLCANPFCNFHDCAIDRDITGSMNISSRNYLNGSIKRLFQHIQEYRNTFSFIHPEYLIIRQIRPPANGEIRLRIIESKIKSELLFLFGRLEKLNSYFGSFYALQTLEKVKDFDLDNLQDIMRLAVEDWKNYLEIVDNGINILATSRFLNLPYNDQQVLALQTNSSGFGSLPATRYEGLASNIFNFLREDLSRSGFQTNLISALKLDQMKPTIKILGKI